jgi:hypothetical protein
LQRRFNEEETEMLRTSVKLTAATALLTFAALGAAFALPSDGARLAGPSLAAPSGLEEVSYRSSRCFRQCVAGRRHRSCQSDAQGNKENCCAQRCRRRW